MKTGIKVIVTSIFFGFASLVPGQDNLYLRAEAFHKKMQYSDAINYLNSYLKIYPKYDNAILLRAKSYLNVGNYTESLSDLENLKVTKNTELLLYKARANAGLSKQKVAIEILEEYLTKTSKQPQSQIEAYPEFADLQINPLWATLWSKDRYSRKEVLINNAKYAIKTESYAEAADRLDEYLSKYTRSAEAYYLRGNLYLKDGDYKQAFKNYEKAVERDTESYAYLCALSSCYHKLKKYNKALAGYTIILKSDSLYINAYYGRAETNLLLKNYGKALLDIKKFRKYYPDHDGAKFLNAKIDAESGDYLYAISNYSQLIKTNPGNANYFIGRAKAYMATKTFKYAIKDFSMALDLEPKNIGVYKQKAKAHQSNGELDKACADWKYASKLGDIESLDYVHKYCK